MLFPFVKGLAVLVVMILKIIWISLLWSSSKMFYLLKLALT